MAGSPILVEFDGPNRRITVKAGVTNIDVQSDLYSDWKEWAQEGDNAKYPPAFRTVGGDPTNPSATQFTPRYFFLQDQYGWEILIDGETVVVQLNLLAESGLSPFRVVNNGAVTNRTSDAQVIQSEIEEELAYDGVVHYDEHSLNTGTAYPVGTVARPVNNIADAYAIALARGYTEFHVHGDMVLDRDFDGWTFQGESLVTAEIYPNGFVCDGCTFNRVTIDGNFGILGSPSQGMYAQECRFHGGVTNWAGLVVSSTFESGVTLQDGDATFIQCNSEVAGVNTPVFDRNNTVGDLNVRGWYGGIELQNFSQGYNASFDLGSGHFKIGPTNTAGTIVLRGVGKLTNTLGSPQVSFDYQGFVDGRVVQRSEKVLRNKMVTDPTTGKQVLYDDDGVTILYQADLYEDKDGTTPYRGQGADRRERLE